MHVLVTGAAGFIGSHLVEALLRSGYRVVGVDRRSPAANPTAATNLAGSLGDRAFTFIGLDVTTGDLTAPMRRCEAVFHLAAIPGVRASWGRRFEEYVTANIVGTARLLHACEQAGVRRLVFASSSSVYGGIDRPSRETDVTRPVSPYGVTKLAAEQLCLAHMGRRDSGLTVCGLRYFTVYGPRQRADMAMSRVLTAALDGVPLRLYGDGMQRREFTYVSDVVAATLAAARVPQPPPVVNVGGGESVTMTEVLKIAEGLTGRPVPVVPAGTQAGDVAATEADLTLARVALGYRPEVSLAEGMARHIEWLRAIGPERRHTLLLPGQESPAGR
jgi:nucleoside-diphosphate-sugar epimerase